MVKKKIDSIWLKALLFLSFLTVAFILLPLSAEAAVHYEGEHSQAEQDYYINTQEKEYWVATENEWHQCEVYDNSASLDTVTAKIRSAMLNRDDAISFYFVTSNAAFTDVGTVINKVNDTVYSPTDNIASGDYLRQLSSFNDSGSSAELSVPNSEGYTFFYLNIAINNLTTSHQEELVKQYVDEWNEKYINQNDIIAASSGDEREYYIVKSIYNFIAKNTTYDLDIYNDKDQSKYPLDSKQFAMAHSAYGALFGNLQSAYNDDFKYVEIYDENGNEIHKYNVDISYTTDGQGLYRIFKKNQGRSVCEGYSLLFYYMCRSNGIDCKIITGDYDESAGLKSDPHAWNMVKLKDCYDTDYEWYAIDSTFGSQRSQKISDEFSIVSYDFFLRGSEDVSFSAKTHQTAYPQYASVMSLQSRENYRFNVTNIDEDNIEIFVSRRRTEDASEKFVEDGKYNLENYIIIDSDNNFYKINNEKNKRVPSDGFTFYGTGYWYSFEIYDFAKGIEYACDDRYLLNAGSYPFDVITTIDGKIYSRDINIEPLDMGKLESYDLSHSTVNDKAMSGGGSTSDLSINADFTGAAINIKTKIFDSSEKELIEGTDYDFLIYRKDDSKKTPTSAKNPNSYIVSVVYKGNYKGTLDIPFNINKLDLAKFASEPRKITFGNSIESYVSDLVFTNKETGEKTVFKKGVDFEIASISDYQNVGDKGEIVVKSLPGSEYIKENSSVKWEYVVANPRNMSSVFNGATINKEAYTYTGKEIKPTGFKMSYKNGDKVVDLVLNKDYKITGYANNINPGKATVNVEFIGNYTGKASLYFTIVKNNAPVPTNFTVSKSSFVYNGKVQRPTVTVKNSSGKQLEYKKDFTVSYSNWNSKNVGSYKMTVTFIGSYSSSSPVVYTYKITPQKSVTPKLNRNTFTLSSSVQRPTVTVTDCFGNKLEYKKDFKVDYSSWSSKAVGRYTVTVTMMGNYSGTKTYAYYINPKPTTFKTSAQGGFKGVKNGFTLKWNKQTGITGYQIQYSTRSDFSNAATVYGGNANATSKTITGRAGNTRYYVRIRTYKNINGKYFYSSWSTGTKSVVTLR